MDGKNERTQTEQRLQHRVEELEKRAFKDALSGLLNRETAELCVKKRLGEMRAGENCALFIVDLATKISSEGVNLDKQAFNAS